MAKKDNDNFDFETESEGKGKLDIVAFFKNLTKQQKGIILIAAVAIVLVIAIVVTCIIIGTSGGFNGNDNGDNNIGDDNLDLSDVATDFYISSTPSKISYVENEDPDYSGLVFYLNSESTGDLFISYNDNPEEFTFTGFDSSVPVEAQIITVECRGLTDTFTISVRKLEDTPPILTGIHLDPMPKTEYKVGEKFSYKTGKIVCTYDDGSTKVVDLTLNELSGFEGVTKEVGEHVITVKYRENGVTMKTTYTITVTE